MIVIRFGEEYRPVKLATIILGSLSFLLQFIYIRAVWFRELLEYMIGASLVINYAQM